MSVIDPRRRQGLVAARWQGDQVDRRTGAVRKGRVMHKMSLTALVRQQLEVARKAESGRSAHTVYGGHEKTLRQTVISLRRGHELAEHENPGEATLQILQGRVRLSTKDAEWDGMPGDFLIIPQDRHGVKALEDCVVLLTVAKLG
jgi:quercetin dioxygenase-like cupin family protein